MKRISILTNKGSNLSAKVNLQDSEIYEYNFVDDLINANISFDYIIINLQTLYRSFNALRKIKLQGGFSKIIVACRLNFKTGISKFLDEGIDGFIFSPVKFGELNECIREIEKGRKFYSLEFPSVTVPLLIKEKGLKDVYGNIGNLTRKEVLILKLIADEYTNPEIAEKLKLSNRTIDSHRRNLLIKLGVKNTAGLVKFACRTGICICNFV